ncbi:hypothetical protein T439DRAFT_326154 [Meredithblackwellia eburnea MCA 4105]
MLFNVGLVLYTYLRGSQSDDNTWQRCRHALKSAFNLTGFTSGDLFRFPYTNQDRLDKQLRFKRNSRQQILDQCEKYVKEVAEQFIGWIEILHYDKAMPTGSDLSKDEKKNRWKQNKTRLTAILEELTGGLFVGPGEVQTPLDYQYRSQSSLKPQIELARWFRIVFVLHGIKAVVYRATNSFRTEAGLYLAPMSSSNAFKKAVKNALELCETWEDTHNTKHTQPGLVSDEVTVHGDAPWESHKRLNSDSGHKRRLLTNSVIANPRDSLRPSTTAGPTRSPSPQNKLQTIVSSFSQEVLPRDILHHATVIDKLKFALVFCCKSSLKWEESNREVHNWEGHKAPKELIWINRSKPRLNIPDSLGDRNLLKKLRLLSQMAKKLELDPSIRLADVARQPHAVKKARQDDFGFLGEESDSDDEVNPPSAKDDPVFEKDVEEFIKKNFGEASSLGQKLFFGDGRSHLAELEILLGPLKELCKVVSQTSFGIQK